MRNLDLLRTLRVEESTGENFHRMTATISDCADQECFRKANELEEDGLIVLSECGYVNFNNFNRMVNLKGHITKRGMDVLETSK